MHEKKVNTQPQKCFLSLSFFFFFFFFFLSFFFFFPHCGNKVLESIRIAPFPSLEQKTLMDQMIMPVPFYETFDMRKILQTHLLILQTFQDMELESRSFNTFVDFEEIEEDQINTQGPSPSKRRQDHKDCSSHPSQVDMHGPTSQNDVKPCRHSCTS